MNKYNTEDYFSVRERRTGKKICDCGDFEDARMMMNLDTPNREIVKNKTLMGQVIDVVMPKALPTNIIAINTEHQDEWIIEHLLNQLPQIKLPDRQQEPFRV
jgi:predicted metal-dependent hydrolase